MEVSVVQGNARDWLGFAKHDNDAAAANNDGYDGYASQDFSEVQDDDEFPSGQLAVDNGIHIAVVRPRNFRDAATVGEYYRQEIPVVINLEDMEKVDATRIIDFVSGLILGLGGDLERISRRTFLIVPADATIITTHDGLTEEGFFNQALRSGVRAGPGAGRGSATDDRLTRSPPSTDLRTNPGQSNRPQDSGGCRSRADWGQWRGGS
jgi:cell division inhibitor SepF